MDKIISIGACRACGASYPEDVTEKGLHILRCRACGTIYQQEKPSEVKVLNINSQTLELIKLLFCLALMVPAVWGGLFGSPYQGYFSIMNGVVLFYVVIESRPKNFSDNISWIVWAIFLLVCSFGSLAGGIYAVATGNIADKGMIYDIFKSAY